MALARRPVQLALLREARRQRAMRLMRARRERWRHRFKRLRRAFLAVALILLAGFGTGMIVALPDTFWLLLPLFALVAFFVLAIYPASPRPRAEDLHEAELGELAACTELWLEGKRRALPSPALDAVDLIGVRLEQLSPQLKTLDPAHPAAREVRKLLSEHLPALVDSYTRIPPPLRSRAHAGSTPAAQLTEGLGVIATQIEAMSVDLSQGDLDALAVRGRFLESKYAESGGA